MLGLPRVIEVEEKKLKDALSRAQTRKSREAKLTEIVKQSPSGDGYAAPGGKEDPCPCGILESAKSHFADTLRAPANLSEELWPLYEAMASYLFEELVLVEEGLLERSYSLMPRRIARPSDAEEEATVDQYLQLYAAIVNFNDEFVLYKEHMYGVEAEKRLADEEAKKVQEQLRKNWHAQRTGIMTRKEYEDSKTSLTEVIKRSDLISVALERKKYHAAHPKLGETYNKLLTLASDLGLDKHLTLTVPIPPTLAQVSYYIPALRAQIVPYALEFKIKEAA
ncbi:hypothetical protein KY361_06700 [Candidatus Woesearchaeota archaeon]|nr:hypothetical protein [Candidatus Woesearchaeota archaeon]